MDTEPKTIRLRIDADPRLAAAVGGAARYLADAAGIENEAVAQLQSAVIAACREAFGNLSKDHPHLDVSLTRLSDRIEVSLSHEGVTASAAGGTVVVSCRFSAKSRARTDPGVRRTRRAMTDGDQPCTWKAMSCASSLSLQGLRKEGRDIGWWWLR